MSYNLCKSTLAAIPLFVAMATVACIGEIGDGDEQLERAAADFVQDSELAFPDQTGPLERAILLLDSPTEISYQLIDGQRVFEGDILLDDALLAELPEPGKAQQPLAAITGNNRRWPGGVVPYVIENGVVSQDVHNAMAHIAAKTSIQFVQRTNQADYVRWVSGAGCSSYIGRIGGGQPITLHPSCGVGAAIHEMMHALGAWHEQQRVDRDAHVIIRWQNISDAHKFNFDKYLPAQGDELTGYDLGSRMHYGSYAFSKNGQPTIVRASTQAPYQNNGTVMSQSDVFGIQLLYSQLACGCAADEICNASNQCVYFFDVPPSHTHAKAIDKLYEADITKGCGKHRYCPSEPVTREQMATFLARALGLSPINGNHFTDVSSGNTHAGNIYAIAAAGITVGCGNNKFCPKDVVKRDQMASFLARALGLSSANGNYFSDISGNTHAGNINAIYLANVTQGCGNGKYCPGDPVTRAQMASFLVRAFNL